MASISPYRNGYRVQVCVKGARDTKVFRTRREANAWGAARETELRTQANTPPADLHTLAEAMRKYGEEVSPHKRGHRWETIRLDAMIRAADLPVSSKLSEITPDAIGQWRNLRLAQVGPGTVLREIGLLSAVMECARREWRWIAVNPVRDVRKPKMPDHREILITRAQIRAMVRIMGYSPTHPIRSVSQACACCFLAALRTGMRAGELCALTWGDVFDGYCKVRAVDTGAGKTGKRDVPLTWKARRVIERMRGYDPLMVFGLKSQSLDAMFRKYRIRAGLDGFTFHDSRHTAATWLAQHVHVLELCKMFGWKNPARAMVYFNPKASDIADKITRSAGRLLQSGSSP